MNPFKITFTGLVKAAGVLLIVALMLFCLSIQVFGKPRARKPLKCGTFLSNCQGQAKGLKRAYLLKKHTWQYQKRKY